ncbi:hypothetical protein L6164_013966 [Bauhinia variegata]|uniref:Uncharacterized protein n=1 Tax=Bauhinia variegata TaxID=167791 RepID=A0ACB9NH27_BAUVA|nr:hypothetical protein L6164_013966 [Bauhinia variegata]
MPGTIMVSVMELMGLPLSSSSSITVSMGKAVYEICQKGDFSFPLASLRNDLIILLQDVEGNEISRIGIEAKSIVEKGVWEDLFSLGGGHLHLKLQFILNDEEREKIRMMRQSALKKKHDELLNSSSLRSTESATTCAKIAALPSCTIDEVSDLPKRHLQLEAASVKEKDSPVEKVLLLGAEPDQKQLNPNIADQNKEMPSTASVSKAVHLTQLQCKDLIKKPVIHSPSMDDPQGGIGSKAILLGRSEQNVASIDDLIQPGLENTLGYPDKQNPSGKTPSNVRKMISAFESGLVQDRRSHIKPPPENCQFSEIEINAFTMYQHSKDDKAHNTEVAGFLKGRTGDSSHAGELQHVPVYIRESREQFNLLSHVSCKETKQLEELSTITILNKQTDSTHKTDKEEEKYNIDLLSTSTFETFTVSGKMLEKYSGRNHPFDIFSCQKNSQELCIQGASPHKLDSLLFYFDESSGAWIFPDEGRKFCLQTGGKILMDLLESQVKWRISHQRSLEFSLLEVADKNAASIGTGTELSDHGKIQKIEESKSKNSDDNGDKISGGPVKKVIKAAIIVGFGILLLLTRQRKSRHQRS